VVASKYRHFGWMYCLFIQHLAVLVVKHPWRLESSIYGKQALYKVFMEFILLMDRKKCWVNTPLQVLRAAPALHSLTIHGRDDVANILEFRNHIRGDLRKLIIERCWLGKRSTGLLENIVAFYPDLEVLSLKGCHQLKSGDYCPIPGLKKLSELNVYGCVVRYM
jgi:hypothetical protein